MLKETILNDIKSAMKAGDSASLEVLRGLNSAIKNQEIDKRGKGDESELSENEYQDVIKREVKKRRDAANLFREGGRPELAEKEETEIKILQKYLPEELSHEALEGIVLQVLADRRAANLPMDFGPVMKAIMDAAAGRADGRVVSEILKAKL
ncbi:MAG: GatB/YqeY domain-containing protein [Candidatus Harrisonbacteria bacterium]|nr:GatB/YqeY domain-containing protein [Candidatus Harrisonbacteria bacterium]